MRKVGYSVIVTIGLHLVSVIRLAIKTLQRTRSLSSEHDVVYSDGTFTLESCSRTPVQFE